MTAEDAAHGHPSATQDAITLDGLHGIFGAGRHEAAGWWKQGRDRPLVSSQQLQRDEFGNVAQERPSDPRASGFGLPASALLFAAVSGSVLPDSFCSITANARVTSLRTAAKSVVSNDFFGLMTTSAAIAVSGSVMRTASRKRRFMRLRWTAPPRARPTVNPTRRPGIRPEPGPAPAFSVATSSVPTSGRGQ